jgi:hypothetical protein
METRQRELRMNVYFINHVTVAIILAVRISPEPADHVEMVMET